MQRQRAETTSGQEVSLSHDEGTLSDFLFPLIRSGTPRVSPVPGPEPVSRIWPPKREIDVASAMTLGTGQVVFMKRHPALDLPCFSTIETRKIGKSPRSSSRGRQARYYCPKVGRTLRAASDGEYFLMLWGQIDPNKSHLVEQPLYLRCPDSQGARLEHRPDLFELRRRAPWFVESKEEKEAAKYESKWNSIGSALSLLGFGYEVITDRHIKKHRVRFSNMKRIWLARRSLPEWSTLTAAECAVRAEIQESGICLIGALLDRVPELSFRRILALIYHNVLPTDVELPLSTASPLFPPQDDEPLRRAYRMLTDPYSIAP